MTIPLNDLLLGGPGHDGYAYNADIYCVSCGEDIIRDLYAKAPPADLDETSDSDHWPCPIFFGESDCAQHCAECGEYMYDPQEEEVADDEPEWWIEDKHSGKGESVYGTFADACRAAGERCTTDGSRWCVWEQPGNVKVAEVSMRGVEWRAAKHNV